MWVEVWRQVGWDYWWRLEWRHEETGWVEYDGSWQHEWDGTPPPWEMNHEPPPEPTWYMPAVTPPGVRVPETPIGALPTTPPTYPCFFLGVRLPDTPPRKKLKPST